MAEDGGPPPKKAKLSREDLVQLSKEELIEKCCEQESVIKSLEAKVGSGDGNDELVSLRESEEKLKQQQSEATRRENILVMRLTSKEQDMQELLNQIKELQQAQNPSAAQLRSMLLDPAINLMFQRMKKEMEVAKEKMEQAQNDLAAWKFTPDSQTGKRLMNRCRVLLQENEELGRVIASGRTAKLEGEIALEKKFVEEMKTSQAETDEFLVEMDEDVEGMQSTIYFLQQQLKDTKDALEQLQAENARLKQVSAVAAAHTSIKQEADVRTGNEEALVQAQAQAQAQESSNMHMHTNSPTPAQQQLSSSGSGEKSRSHSPSEKVTNTQTTATATAKTNGCTGSMDTSQQQQQHVAMETSDAPVEVKKERTDSPSLEQQVWSLQCDNGEVAPSKRTPPPQQASLESNHQSSNNHRTTLSAADVTDGTDISSDAWSPQPSATKHTDDSTGGREEHSEQSATTRTAKHGLGIGETLHNGMIGTEDLAAHKQTVSEKMDV